MQNIFQDELTEMNSYENIYNSVLVEAVVDFSEKMSGKHYITESDHKSLYVKLKEFFANIITSFKMFYNKIQIKLKSFVKENSIEIKLRTLRKDLQTRKENGERYINTINLQKYKETYIHMVNDLWKYGKKFQKISYKSVDQIDKDMEKFNSLLSYYNKELEKIETKEYTIKIKDAIQFVTNEIDGQSDTLKTISNSINQVKEMETIASNLELKRNMLGNDVIPKHIFFLKRICNSILNFVRKNVAKFVSIVVFLFA